MMSGIDTEGESLYYTYIVQCADGSLYCGWTDDLNRRMDAHNGTVPGGAKYTRGRRPVVLVHYECFQSKQEAQHREWVIKQLSRVQKLKLINDTK